MSQYPGPGALGGQGPTAEPSTADAARAEAAGVGQHTRDAGGQVAQTAADQARQVAAETSRQARDLLVEAQGHAHSQASVQQQRAAQQLHSVADELHAMAASGGQSGMATEVARQAADRMHGAASWLEQREPADLLEEVRSFARRRPGTFLIGAAVAGLAAGRLTRGLTARDNQGSGPGRGTVSGDPGTTTAGGGAAGFGYQEEPAYTAGGEPSLAGAPAYPAQPTFTPGPGYADDVPPAGPGTRAFPAEPPYPYPVDTAPAGGTAEPGDVAAYPADAPYPPEPYPAEPPYPPEPGTGSRTQGSR